MYTSIMIRCELCWLFTKWHAPPKNKWLIILLFWLAMFKKFSWFSWHSALWNIFIPYGSKHFLKLYLILVLGGSKWFKHILTRYLEHIRQTYSHIFPLKSIKNHQKTSKNTLNIFRPTLHIPIPGSSLSTQRPVLPKHVPPSASSVPKASAGSSSTGHFDLEDQRLVYHISSRGYNIIRCYRDDI